MSKNQNYFKQYFVSVAVAVASFIVAMLVGFDFLDSSAVTIFSFSLALLIIQIGTIIPVKELALFLASLQWLLAPVYIYAAKYQHYKYYMYVGRETYMPFAIFGTMAFAAGLLLFDNKEQYRLRPFFLDKIVDIIESQKNLPYCLILIGIIFSYLSSFAPPSLLFVFYLLSNIKYVGILYLLFSKDKNRWLFLCLALILTFISSINTAMFHNLLLWIAFIGMYVCVVIRVKLRVKVIALLVMAVFILSIQLVKADLRKSNQQGSSSQSPVNTFFNLLSAKTSSTEADGKETQSLIHNMMTRVNQGWIISRIMYYIPGSEPYMKGESIQKALYASVSPRFLFLDKQVAGGQDYFERVTGFPLVGTSMGSSLLGEGYANFGTQGALIFVFIIGVIYCFVINWFYGIAVKRPTLILWLPLIFLQVVKAESDLLRVLNYMTKAIILVLIVSWILRKIFANKL